MHENYLYWWVNMVVWVCVSHREKQTFAATRPSSVLLEQLAVCVTKGEPVLLVGETGTGKTSTVQYLAGLTGGLVPGDHSEPGDALMFGISNFSYLNIWVQVLAVVLCSFIGFKLLVGQ